MVSLAIYDKHYGDKDRKITSKYKWDYIYLRGLNMRIGVVMGYIIVCAMYYLHKLIIQNADMFEIITKDTFKQILIRLVIVLIIYTVICSFKYRKEYKEAESRMALYEERLEKLNSINDEE